MLTRIWDFLFHRHHWETVREYTINNDGSRVGILFVQRCTKCGSLQRKQVKPG